MLAAPARPATRPSARPAPLPTARDLRPPLWEPDEPIFPGLLAVLSLAAGLFWTWVVVTPAPADDPLDVADSAAAIEGLPRLELREILPPPPEVPTPPVTPPPDGGGRAPRAEAFPAETPEAPSRAGETIHEIGTMGEAFHDLFAPDPELDEAIRQVGGGLEAGRVLSARVGAAHGPAEVGVGTVEGGPVGTGNARPVQVGPPPTSEVVADLPDGDQERILAVVRRNNAQIQNCVDISAKTHPNLDGRVVLSWSIADGEVSRVRVVDTTAREPELEACMVRAVRRFAFPKDVSGFVAEMPWVMDVGG